MRRSLVLAVSAVLLGLCLPASPAFSAGRSGGAVPGGTSQAASSHAGSGPAGAPCRPGSGPKLRGKDFTRTPLPRPVRCADLTGARFDGADLTGVDLTGAILRNASFRETELTQAYLNYADLTGADFTDAEMIQVRAQRATARNAVFTEANGGQSDFSHADLTGARFTRAEFGQAEFADAKLAGADLSEAELVQLKGREADFTGATLRDARLGQARLQFAVFRDADLSGAALTQAELRGAELAGAKVDDAVFTQARDLDLTGAKGTPKDVPDDATGRPSGRPAADPEPRPGDAGDVEPVTPTPAGRSGPPAGLVLIVLGSFGLALTLVLWGVSHRRRTREAAAFAIARRQAEEEVTRFGEEIDALDFEMRLHEATVSADLDWRHALDAYEGAKHILATARTIEQLGQLRHAVAAGRNALGRLRARRG